MAVATEDLKGLGEKLKDRRTELNLSLKEVENATSIRMNFLKGIEDGEVQKLISPVYAQGFVNQYASYLGIESDDFMKANPEAFGVKPSQEFSYGIGTLETRDNPSARVKWFPNFIWAVATVMVLLSAYLLAKFLELV